MTKYRRKECVQVFRDGDSSTCSTTEEKRRGGF